SHRPFHSPALPVLIDHNIPILIEHNIKEDVGRNEDLQRRLKQHARRGRNLQSRRANVRLAVDDKKPVRFFTLVNSQVGPALFVLLANRTHASNFSGLVFLNTTWQPSCLAPATQEFWAAKKGEVVNFQERLRRFVMAVAGDLHSSRAASVDATGRACSRPFGVARKVLVVLLIALAAPASAIGQQNPPSPAALPNPLSLSQAVMIALSHNSVIREAQARLAQASGRYAQSRAPMLPQVEGRARQDYLTINLQGLGITVPGVPPGKSDPFGSLDARIILSQDLLMIANREASN